MVKTENDKSSIVESFKINNSNLHNDKDISNGFCNFFSNVGKSYASKIADGNKDYQDYLSKGYNPKPNSLFLYPADEMEIKKKLSHQLKARKIKAMMDFLQITLKILKTALQSHYVKN